MLLNQKGGYEQRPENTNTKSGQAKGGRVPLARGRDHAGGAIGPFYLDDSYAVTTRSIQPRSLCMPCPYVIHD